MEFKTVEQDIRPILKNNYVARCDDMALYTYYAYEKIQDQGVGLGWLQKIFTDRRFRILNGIASYETVSRVRRKLQEKYEDLRPPEDLKEERKKVEAEYRKYAREKGGGLNE